MATRAQFGGRLRRREGACGSSGEGSVERSGGLGTRGGSKRLLCRVCQVFLENLPAMWAAIQTSVANRDAVAIQHSAHTLKGSASVIGARAATAAARELEMRAKSGKLDGVGLALDYLDRELKRLTAAVADLRDQSAWEGKYYE